MGKNRIYCGKKKKGKRVVSKKLYKFITFPKQKKGRFKGSKKEVKAFKLSCVHYQYDKKGKISHAFERLNDETTQEFLQEFPLPRELADTKLVCCRLCKRVFASEPISIESLSKIVNGVKIMLDFTIATSVTNSKNVDRIKTFLMIRAGLRRFTKEYKRLMLFKTVDTETGDVENLSVSNWGL
jgi:hypothetical protein